MKYPPPKAPEGYPPVAKSAEALMGRVNDPNKVYSFNHGQGPCLYAEVLHQSICQVRVSPACAKPRLAGRRQGTQAWSSA